MNVGVTLPHVGAFSSRSGLIAAVRQAEHVGLSSVWVSDHIAFPVEAVSLYPYSKEGKFPVPYETPFLEAFIVLSFVASQTERITLGSSVLVLPLRNTILAAKQIGTLGFLAPNRIILGLGAGWLREEFEVLEAPFSSRGHMLEEQISALRGLLSQEGFERSGSLVSFPALLMEPRPPSVPTIWLGGTSAAALRRAGRFGDAWHAIGTRDLDELASMILQVRDAARENGRDPADVALTARIGGKPGIEGLANLDRRIEALENLGFTHVVVDAALRSTDEVIDFYGDLGALASRWKSEHD